MSVINPIETASVWRAQKREAAVHLYLSGASGNVAELVGARVAGFPVNLSIVSPTDTINVEEIGAASAAVVEVGSNDASSLKRFETLAAATKTPLVAAVYDPPLAFVRSLVRAGAHDVVPLPLDFADLETSLLPIRDEILRRNSDAHAANGKIICAIKSVGGIGATALLSQLAIQAAQREAPYGREVCLLDLDMQFGNSAFQLGLRPTLSVHDLVEAGERLDADLFRSTTTEHASGLKLVAAPPSMLPLESVTSEQILSIVEIAKRQFDSVFIDLPANWTNWSLSLLAQADLVLLITELTIGSLHRARRQLDLLRDQDLSNVDVRIVVNRFEKRLLRTIRPADVHKTLGREIWNMVADDPEVMHAATEQGVPIGEIKRKSAVGKDINMLEIGVAAALGRERG